MILKQIELKNFRNYENILLNLNDNVNIIIGNNAQGKTNLLESIYVLSITKSFREIDDKILLKEGSKYLRIKGKVVIEESNKNKDLEITISKKGKKVMLNGVVVKKISQYISNLNVIVFSPNDLSIVKGAPSERRKFLNIELSQLYEEYVNNLNDYNKILKNRNKYLKSIKNDKYDNHFIDIVTNQLIKKAIPIYKYRKKFLDELTKNIKQISNKIFNSDAIKIQYKTSVIIEDMIEEKIKERLTTKYKKNILKEIMLSQTLYGPHRDDFSFFLAEKELKNFGSQGQQRATILALKLAEIEIFSKKKGEYPLVLLDDIFSELDQKTQNNVFELINGKGQKIITTTDLDNIDINKIKNKKVFSINDAKITIEEVK